MSTPFPVKSWANAPSTSTPISAASLEDLETRLSTFARLNTVAVSTTHTAADGELLICASGGYIVTLPAPAANAAVTVLAGSVSSGPIAVTTPTGAIIGSGSGSVTTIMLNQIGAYAALYSDGANWYITASQLVPYGPGPVQQGVLGSGDLIIHTSSQHINASTSALTFTPQPTGSDMLGIPAWIQTSSAFPAGPLAPVYYNGAAVTLTPGAVTSGDYAVIGVEIDLLGVMHLITGTSTATQLNTGALIASNSPTVTTAQMRIADIAIWNNSGTYQFSNHSSSGFQGVTWIDRRPWALGALSGAGGSGFNYSTTTTSGDVIVSATQQTARIEINTLSTLVVTLNAQGSSSVGADGGLTSFYLNGVSQSGGAPLGAMTGTTPSSVGYSATAGVSLPGVQASVLVQPSFAAVTGGTFTISNLFWTVQELPSVFGFANGTA